DNGTTITVVGIYGTLVVTKATGAYTYTLANGQANVQALAEGQRVTDVFTYTNSDNHGGSSSSTLTVTVTGTDDAPALSVVAAGTKYTNTAVTLLSAASTTVSDGDNQTLQSATVMITDFVTGDVLSANVAGTNIKASYANGVLTLSGNDTLANYKQVLNSVTYSSTSADPSNSGTDTSRTISWVVNDGTLLSATQTTTLNIASIIIYSANKSLNGDAIVADFIEVKSGVTVSGFGTINANVIQIDQGASIVAQSSHTLDITVTGHITGTGKLEITNNTTLKLTGPVASTVTVQFDIGNGPSPVLILEDPFDFHAQITGFQST